MMNSWLQLRLMNIFKIYYPRTLVDTIIFSYYTYKTILVITMETTIMTKNKLLRHDD